MAKRLAPTVNQTHQPEEVEVPVGPADSRPVAATLAVSVGGRQIVLRLARRERQALGRVLAGLQHQGATIAPGRPVQTAQDAIRWLLQAIPLPPEGEATC